MSHAPEFGISLGSGLVVAKRRFRHAGLISPKGGMLRPANSTITQFKLLSKKNHIKSRKKLEPGARDRGSGVRDRVSEVRGREARGTDKGLRMKGKGAREEEIG